MKNLLLSIVGVMCLALSMACTSNQRAKTLGGTMEITLPEGMKLVNASWKNDDLWYLYRPMVSGEAPVRSILKEDSSFGVLSGTVIFNERRAK